MATVRKHRVELRSRSAGQAQQVPRNGADPWDGPAHLVQNAMLRVIAILGELRRLRGAAGGGTES